MLSCVPLPAFTLAVPGVVINTIKTNARLARRTIFNRFTNMSLFYPAKDTIFLQFTYTSQLPFIPVQSL